MKRTLISLTSVSDPTLVREDTFNNKPHLVVPVVALVEGVVRPGNGNGDGELALMSEVGRFPQGWDGRPTILNHPTRNGLAVSANDLQVKENQVFGQLFNTLVDQGKLKTEAWIDLDRIAELAAADKDPATSEFNTLVADLRSGERVVEVSVGVFVTAEEASGNFSGDTYEVIWRNPVPDHLAFLSKGVRGACSAEMGCGAPRLNSLQVLAEFEEGTACQCKQPKTVDEPKKEPLYQKVMSWLGDRLQFRAASDSLSDVDTRRAISAALAAEGESYCYVVAVFSNNFVYEEGYDGQLYQRAYSISGEGTVTLSKDVTQVRPITSFVPVTINGADPISTTTLEGNTMTLKERIAALIAAQSNPFDATHQPWLETQTEEQIATLEAQKFEVAPAKPKELTAEEKAAEDARLLAELTRNNKVVSADEYIAAAPKELQGVLKAGLKLQEQHRTQLIRSLAGLPNSPYSETELAAMETDALDKLAKLASVPSFEALGTRFDVLSSNDSGAPEAPKLWD